VGKDKKTAVPAENGPVKTAKSPQLSKIVDKAPANKYKRAALWNLRTKSTIIFLPAGRSGFVKKVIERG
jgi:hypothetical protein